MKQFTIRIITMIIVQQAAMIFFMRVARWQIFESAGISALIAMAAGFAVYFVQRRVSARKGL
jgi:hypothetical protein